MKAKFLQQFFLALFIVAAVTPAIADTAYVTDKLRITLRSGESASHRILRMLPSGTEVEVVKRNPSSGYSQVRVGGATGYVLTRQLLNEPVARDRIAVLEKEVADLRSAPGELRTRLDTLRGEHASLQKDHADLQKVKRNIEQELAALQRTSSNAIRIANERNELRNQVAKLKRELDEVEQQRMELENSSTQRWFLIGAGVLAGGILLGLILPHLRINRRKSSWDSL